MRTQLNTRLPRVYIQRLDEMRAGAELTQSEFLMSLIDMEYGRRDMHNSHVTSLEQAGRLGQVEVLRQQAQTIWRQIRPYTDRPWDDLSESEQGRAMALEEVYNDLIARADEIEAEYEAVKARLAQAEAGA